MNEQEEEEKKPRFLCLHGFRTSGEIMKKQIGKWPNSVLEKLDLVFLDAPFPCQGKSDVEGIFPPPYYEWFQFNPVIHLSFFSISILCFFFFFLKRKETYFSIFFEFQEFSEYENFDECLAYIEDFMIKQGPFDGLMGFSQVPSSSSTPILFNLNHSPVSDLKDGTFFSSVIYWYIRERFYQLLCRVCNQK